MSSLCQFVGRAITTYFVQRSLTGDEGLGPWLINLLGEESSLTLICFQKVL